MKKLLLFVGVVSLFVLVSCSSGGDEPDIEATVVAGISATQEAIEPTDEPIQVMVGEETRYQFLDNTVSITLPDDWEMVDLEKMDFDMVMEAMGENNESLEGMFSSEFFQSLVDSGIKFYAINTSLDSLRSPSPATINVMQQELPFSLTLEEYTELNVSELEQLLDLTSDVEREQLRFGDNEATKINYTANLVDPFGRAMEIMNNQYMMMEEVNDTSTAYIVTVSMSVDLVDEYADAYEETAETFRLAD